MNNNIPTSTNSPKKTGLILIGVGVSLVIIAVVIVISLYFTGKLTTTINNAGGSTTTNISSLEPSTFPPLTTTPSASSTPPASTVASIEASIEASKAASAASIAAFIEASKAALITASIEASKTASTQASIEASKAASTAASISASTAASKAASTAASISASTAASTAASIAASISASIAASTAASTSASIAASTQASIEASIAASKAADPTSAYASNLNLSALKSTNNIDFSMDGSIFNPKTVHGPYVLNNVGSNSGKSQCLFDFMGDVTYVGTQDCSKTVPTSKSFDPNTQFKITEVGYGQKIPSKKLYTISGTGPLNNGVNSAVFWSQGSTIEAVGNKFYYNPTHSIFYLVNGYDGNNVSGYNKDDIICLTSGGSYIKCDPDNNPETRNMWNITIPTRINFP